MASAKVHFCGTGDPVTVLSHGLVALFEEGQDLIDIPFNNRPHGVKTVIESAGLNNFQAASDVLTNAFPLVQWRDTEFQQNHSVSISECLTVAGDAGASGTAVNTGLPQYAVHACPF